MPRPRDYAAEYARRITRGVARGLSHSEARGHVHKPPFYDPDLEEGIARLRHGKSKSLTRAAKDLGVAPEHLRAYAEQSGIFEKERGRWRIAGDDRLRQMPIYSKGEARTVLLRGGAQWSTAGRYMAAVKAARRQNDPSLLDRFRGAAVIDVTGREYPLETNLNVLYRLPLEQEESFEDIYKILRR